MNFDLSKVEWGRVLLAGGIAALLSMGILCALIFAYATTLAVQARGQPDVVQITRFASQVSPWAGTLLAMALTIVGAAWVARKAKMEPQLHGLLVGLVVALIVLMISTSFRRSFDLVALFEFVLMVAAGWLGSRLSARSISSS